MLKASLLPTIRHNPNNPEDKLKEVGKKIHGRLRTLDDILDRGLLAGSLERRDGKRLIRELRELVAEVNQMEASLKTEDEEVSTS